MNFKKLLLTLSVAAVASNASASVIVTAEAGGVLTNQHGFAGVNFDDGTKGSYAGLTGDYAIYDAPGGTHAAEPLGITDGKYIATPSASSTGSATFTLDGSYDYFGLYWGSIDVYNTITFFDGATEVASFDGNDLGNGLGFDGDQTSEESNRFINFYFGDGESYDSIVMGGTEYAFESDNHAYGIMTDDTSGEVIISVSEPASLALFVLGLAGLGSMRRRG